MTDDEKLVFKKWDGGKKHTLEYAKDIIRVEGSDFSPLYSSAKVYGESPSSFKGSDTSHWLTKQEVKGESGTGPVLAMSDPAVRDQQTASTVAKAMSNRLEYTFSVHIKIVGNPEIKLGDTVILKGLPVSAFKGDLGVRGIEHYLSKNEGFTTTINCWMKA
jgi:hypothetical protein